MSIDFASRLIGMVVFAFVGARLGVTISSSLELNDLAVSFIFGLVGVLFGLVLTPWLTVRPIRLVRRIVNELSIDVLFMTLIGTIIGAFLALLISFPLSTLLPPVGGIMPTLVLVIVIYLMATAFYVRAREIWIFFEEWFGWKPRRGGGLGGEERLLLLDTSVLIDGRIVEIAQSGFIGGTLIAPRFVISELHRVADSTDSQRRNRGRRGLSKLNELQREVNVPFKIIEDDPEETPAVDDKLIVLALRMNAVIVTIDYPLNQVAAAQGATVLNINELANAVRSAYIPGESFAIRVIQDGTEANQGVGYLEDGTMVIIKDGRNFMDRTIYVEVTKLINRPTGRIIFAEPTNGNE
ncbi:MAG: PIN domain nuclease [Chloroflexota bacterium]|nr:PIN domain nuclease [Chloroflexota bacterium]